MVNYGGKDYVHAGIAFFGGGRNYCVFDENTGKTTDFVGFEVSLDQVGQTMLKTAAGNENFYFILCDATSTFTPERQTNMLNSNDAYGCIYNK